MGKLIQNEAEGETVFLISPHSLQWKTTGCFFSLKCTLFGNLLGLLLKIKEFVPYAPGRTLSNFSVFKYNFGKGHLHFLMDLNDGELTN